MLRLSNRQARNNIDIEAYLSETANSITADVVLQIINQPVIPET
jgi:hypothetical protein